MSGFRDSVDGFLAQEKTLAGEPKWVDTPRFEGMSCFWLLAEQGAVTDHRLNIVAYPKTHWLGFTVMVDYYWIDRFHPVIRLNIDTSDHEHFNRTPRPTGIEPIVRGNRIYLWSDNRNAFKPVEMLGLPFARSLRPQISSLDNAIRHVCGEAHISPLDTQLPDYPRPTTLV
jgi:hypothetical protein